MLLCCDEFGICRSVPCIIIIDWDPARRKQKGLLKVYLLLILISLAFLDYAIIYYEPTSLHRLE